MSVYKIVLPGTVYSNLRLNRSTFSDKDKARETLVKAFEQYGQQYEMEEVQNKLVFRSKSGAECATIIKIQ